MSAYLQTGQITCHNAKGHMIECTGSGQDAEFRSGLSWPAPRFVAFDDAVLDRLTGLLWTKNANMAEFSLTWQEALDYVATMNRDNVLDFSDWRLPNRSELRSLMSHQTRKPALPEGHPFVNVFSGWYWTSTTAALNTAYAWYIHMEGSRMFYGHGGCRTSMNWNRSWIAARTVRRFLMDIPSEMSGKDTGLQQRAYSNLTGRVGALSHQRRSRRWTEKRRAFLGLGGLRSSFGEMIKYSERARQH